MCDEGNIFGDDPEEVSRRVVEVFVYNGWGRAEFDGAWKFAKRIKKKAGRPNTDFRDFCARVYDRLAA